MVLDGKGTQLHSAVMSLEDQSQGPWRKSEQGANNNEENFARRSVRVLMVAVGSIVCSLLYSTNPQPTSDPQPLRPAVPRRLIIDLEPSLEATIEEEVMEEEADADRGPEKQPLVEPLQGSLRRPVLRPAMNIIERVLPENDVSLPKYAQPVIDYFNDGRWRAIRQKSTL